MTTDSNPANPVNEAVIDRHFSKPANEVTTDSGSPDPPCEPTPYPNNTLNSKRSVSNCKPYRDVIELGLNRGRNAMAIWQDLVTEHSSEPGYQSVKRFVHRLRPVELRQADPVIVTAPGEEAQIDYGTGQMVGDPQSGKYRRTRLFVMTLGYSLKSVRLLVFRSSSRVWGEKLIERFVELACLAKLFTRGRMSSLRSLSGGR